MFHENCPVPDYDMKTCRLRAYNITLLLILWSSELQNKYHRAVIAAPHCVPMQYVTVVHLHLRSTITSVFLSTATTLLGRPCAATANSTNMYRTVSTFTTFGSGEEVGAADEIVQPDALVAWTVECPDGPVCELILRIYRENAKRNMKLHSER